MHFAYAILDDPWTRYDRFSHVSTPETTRCLLVHLFGDDCCQSTQLWFKLFACSTWHLWARMSRQPRAQCISSRSAVCVENVRKQHVRVGMIQVLRSRETSYATITVGIVVLGAFNLSQVGGLVKRGARSMLRVAFPKQGRNSTEVQTAIHHG
ncbi:hypothetical protein F4778DRAFT_688089 [Xylariomycetidae sp. FL2044]|nr:hypothetical protein F4778DRAFT_688089 [Xylariomycetidae sp. FL2044]